MNPSIDRKSDYPFSESRASKMLRSGLSDALSRRGLSQRRLAADLGFKQSVLLSHWASGRVPIPVERALELAHALHLDERSMLLAVLHQRHPNVAWEVLEDQHTPAYDFVSGLENIAGGPVEEFAPGQLRVMREAAADRRAERRWLSVHEVPVIEVIRRHRPNVSETGLEASDLRRMESTMRLV